MAIAFVIVGLLVVMWVVVGFVVSGAARDEAWAPQPQSVCTRCGTVGVLVTQDNGSYSLGVTSRGSFSGRAYSGVTRMVCSCCGSGSTVPVNSPRGLKLTGQRQA
jgi:hypothetical protein